MNRIRPILDYRPSVPVHSPLRRVVRGAVDFATVVASLLVFSVILSGVTMVVYWVVSPWFH